MKPGRVVLLVFGVVIALGALGALVGGIGTLWLRTANTDGEGFLTSPAYQLESDGYALTTPEIDLHASPGDWTPWLGTTETRLTVTAEDAAREMFIGVGPAADV